MAIISCPECNNGVSDQAENCPSCGCPILETIKDLRLKFTETEPDNQAAAGGCAGALGGIMMMVFLLLLGGALSVIGLIFIGIPIIFIGLATPILAPIMLAYTSSKSRKGKCPHCESEISFSSPTFKCNFCKKRVILRDNKFYKI